MSLFNMPVFTYEAIDTKARRVSGTLVADTPRLARDMLRVNGWMIQNVSPIGPSDAGQLVRRWSCSRYRQSTVTFIREMSTLIGVGVPITEALETISRQHEGRFRDILLFLHDRVTAGTGLAQAMQEQPRIFDSVTTSMIDVGENTGNLESVLDRLATFQERAQLMKSKITAALMYPCIVLIMGIAVSILLMVFVVPNLLTNLVAAGKPLPVTTAIVKAISDFMFAYWWLGLFAIGAGLAGLSAVQSIAVLKQKWDHWILNIPLVGVMIRKQTIVRLATVIATLLRSGIPFEHSLKIAAGTTQNTVFRKALAACETAVHAGGDIATSIENTGAFPPVVVQVFFLGQQSGRLEDMLERLAADYDQQLVISSQRLTTLLEPVLIIVLAVIVGFIAFATMMPILEAGDVL